MRRYRTYHDLYEHIVKSFYLGEYHKNDRFPTQIELIETYHVAANSIKKVFKLLLAEGFITTDRSFGTHVTFDLSNPEHLAKVPLQRHDPNDNNIDKLTIPSSFIAYTVYHGLRLASSEQLAGYLRDIDGILQSLQAHPLMALPDKPLLFDICRDINNSYLSDFTDYLQQEYLFVDRQALQDKALCKQVHAISVNFYTTLRTVLADRQFGRIIALCMSYYETLYRIPRLLVFSRVENNRTVFEQQTLYARLVHSLFLYIISNDLRKGDLLPTEHELAREHGVSLITVRKAASVLKEIGLIDGERFVGTRMREDWNSPVVQTWLETLMQRQHKEIADAIFAEYVLGRALYDRACGHILPETIDQMEKMLGLEWDAYCQYHTPLFMSEVFTTPLVEQIASPLLSACFMHVHDDLTKFLAMRLMQLSQVQNTTVRVHHYAARAIAALRRGDRKLFLSEADTAVLLNWELLRTALDQTVYRCLRSQKN